MKNDERKVFKHMREAGFVVKFWPKVSVWLVKFGIGMFFVPGSEKKAFAETGWTRVPDDHLKEAEEFYNA